MGNYKILKGQISIFDICIVKKLNRGETYEIFKKYKGDIAKTTNMLGLR